MSPGLGHVWCRGGGRGWPDGGGRAAAGPGLRAWAPLCRSAPAQPEGRLAARLPTRRFPYPPAARWGVLKAREGEGLEQLGGKTRTPVR